MNNYNEYGLEVTQNLYGYMHEKSPINDAFIEYARTKPEKPLLDIGCAYGVSTIPSLAAGAKVIACDIDPDHLTELKKRTPHEYHDQLQLTHSRFPDALQFEENALSAIILSHVLSFLTKEQILNGFKKLNNWLTPGGKLFVINYTPYHKTIENFIPVYEKRLAERKLFAGEVLDKREYFEPKKISQSVPNSLMLLDVPTLHFLLESNGFDIEFLDYMGGIENGVPAPFCHSQKEWVGCIAIKR